MRVEEFAYIAGKVHHCTVFDGLDGHFFDVFDRKVDVRPVFSVIAVTVVVDFVTFVEFPVRIVHQHYVIAREVVVHVFLKERQRGILLRIYRLALRIFACPRKFCGRLAKIQYEHTIDGAQHFRFAFLYSRRFGSFGDLFAQVQTEFSQFPGNQSGHSGSIVTAERFRHHLLRHYAVFADNVRDSGKLSAVAQRIFEKPLHHAVIHRLCARVDDALQEQVGFFQLVVEKAVVGRETEFAQLETGYHFGAHHVEPCKKPASAGGLLVCNAFRFYFVGEISVECRQVFLIDGEFSRVRARQCVSDGFILRSVLVGLFDLLHHFRRNAAVLLRLYSRECCGKQQKRNCLSFHHSSGFKMVFPGLNCFIFYFKCFIRGQI